MKNTDLKIILLLAVIFLISAMSRSQAQGELPINTRSIGVNEWEIQTPTVKLPMMVTYGAGLETQPRIRYYPTQGLYYDSVISESRKFECITVQSVINLENHAYYLQLKVNGILMDFPHYPTRVFICDCNGTEYNFTALVPSNHDDSWAKKYKFDYDSFDELQFDFD